MALKNKFYVVWDGNEKGVFDSWDKCKKSIDGYANAKYKSYLTLNEAERAFSLGLKAYYNTENKKSVYNVPYIQESIAVDAACSGNPGDMEYRGVYVKTGQEIFKSKIYKYGTNNIGEFLAIVHGLSFLKQCQSGLPIYSDSVNAIKWINQKRCNTKLIETSQNMDLFELINRAEIWLSKNTWGNKIIKWDTEAWGEIPADFGRK